MCGGVKKVINLLWVSSFSLTIRTPIILLYLFSFKFKYFLSIKNEKKKVKNVGRKTKSTGH